MPISKEKQELLQAIRKLAGQRDQQKLDRFLDALLTSSERAEAEVRWQIVKRLADGQPHREIAEELGVGIATVTRGAREFKNPRSGFHWALKQ